MNGMTQAIMEQGIIIYIIELLGTFAFAISGIRHAAAKHFDWFGGYVCGIAVAIGGGTIRDVMLSTTPFWMTTPIYMICTAVALLTVICFGKWMEPLKNAWFVFDTFGLALFTIAGIQKSLLFGQPFWVAIIMGCITGSAWNGVLGHGRMWSACGMVCGYELCRDVPHPIFRCALPHLATCAERR